MKSKQKRTKVVLSVLALAGLVVFSLTAGGGSLEPSAPPGPTMKTLEEVEPRVPIHASDLPLTITEPNSYFLAEDITFASTANHAITIECNDVTIDLMGFSLTGPDSGTKAGIYMSGRTNVEVRNGTVRDFYIGIYEISSASREHRVINVRAMSNANKGITLLGSGHLVKDCTAAENGGIGIYTGPGSTVTGNTAHYNDSAGISANSGSTVTGNTAYGNGDDGIYASTGCTVTGNTAYDNGSDGICVSSGCTVTGNTAYNNDSIGIYAGSSCTVTGNTAIYNYGDGIKVGGWCRVIDNTCDFNGNGGDGAGIHATGNRNRIEGNNVTANDRGIDVDSSSNLIVKNSASGNTTEYDIFGGNKVGTISTDPTTAGPWDNFDF